MLIKPGVSEAPEGATHIDTLWSVFCSESGWWGCRGEFHKYRQEDWGTARYTPVTRPWGGEGMPPAGTVCERQFGGTWHEVTILGVGKNTVWFRYSEDGDEVLCSVDSLVLRALSADSSDHDPAQLEELSAILGSDTLAMRVLDAGYRKEEP